MKLNRTLLLIFAIAGMLPPLVFRLIRWYSGIPLGSWSGFFKSIVVSSLTTTIISCGVVTVMGWLQRNHPWDKGIFKRLGLEMLLTTFTSCTLIVGITLVSHLIDPKPDLRIALFNYLIVALIMNFVLVAITEGIFFFREWKRSAIDAERFKKESIKAQLETLKNQVNPHFLFNSLNTLSSLIDLDKESSKSFLDDLSTVYRYVLQHKDEEVVPLKTEMDFIHSYTQLLKKRHGEQVAFHFNIASEDLKKGIPPMALQLLIENAVKHNIASRRQPLKVELFSLNNHLIIRNNLQPKRGVVSSGIGLNNIRHRYRYLIDQDIEVRQTAEYFEVQLPTIPII